MRVFLLLLCTAATQAQTKHHLKVTPETVIVGYYDPRSTPALQIKSGDTVVIDTLGVASPKALEAAGVPADQIQPELRAVVKAKPTAGFDARYGTGNDSWTTDKFVEAVYRELSSRKKGR